MFVRVKKEEIMNKLFPKDLIDEIEGEIKKNGIKAVNIKELIVYISSFFNEETDAIEKGIKDLKDTFDKSFTENRMLKLVIIAILIPLWGLFLQSVGIL